MIGITILGILVGYGVPSYRSWLENSQIRTAAESIQNGLQLARSEAASRNANVSFTLTGNDWSVDVLALGAASGVFYSAASHLQARGGVEGSRRAVINATQDTVTFNGVGRVTPTLATAITFAITNPTGGVCATAAIPTNMRCLNVVVEPGGKIKMCDPALDGGGSPQACAP